MVIMKNRNEKASKECCEIRHPKKGVGGETKDDNEMIFEQSWFLVGEL